MSIAQLKKIKPNPLKFLTDKKEGYPEYSFEELVALFGYDKAKDRALYYARCVRPRWQGSKLVKTYKEIHADGYIITVSLEFEKDCSLKTNKSGLLYPDYTEHFREWEARMKIKFPNLKIKARPYVKEIPDRDITYLEH